MTKYEFISLYKLVEEQMNAMPLVVETSFTNDTEDDIEMRGEATNWYGMKIIEEFDGASLVCGSYGYGIEFSIPVTGRYEEEVAVDFFNELAKRSDFELLCKGKDAWTLKLCVDA